MRLRMPYRTLSAPDEEQYIRMLRADIATTCPLYLLGRQSLFQNEYLRTFKCGGCYEGNHLFHPDGRVHTVWVQDVVFRLSNGDVVFWKDGTCREVGIPCCHYQSPCTVMRAEEVFRIREEKSNDLLRAH